MNLPATIEMTIGPDTVHVLGEKVTIYATREMPEWTVREFCIPPIHFRGRKYYLKGKHAGPLPYAFRYELAPWYPELGTPSSRVIVYDEDYVAQRERDFKSDGRNEQLHSVLFVFYPLLGFTWSRFKQRVLGPIGFDPINITGASIMLAFAFFMLEGVFVCYFRLGFLALVVSRAWVLWLDYLLFILLPLDCAIRYGHILRHDAAPAGLLEWVFRRNKSGRRWG